MDVLLLVSALLVGSLLAVQASANLQLNAAVGTPYGASMLQLAMAAGLLAVVAIAVGTFGAVRLSLEVPSWQLLGGLASPLYITSGILLFSRLGALAAVGLFVTGQMFASLALDLFGWFGLDRQSLTFSITLGALAVLSGITVIITGQRRRRGQPSGPKVTGVAPLVESPPSDAAVTAATRSMVAGLPGPIGSIQYAAWIVLGLVAGAVLPIQGAVNANLRRELDAPITVGMISFIVATIAIAAVLLLMIALRRTPIPRVRSLGRVPWWGWLGGACAAIYVTASFLLIPEIGAATTVALTVAGQQLASAAIDNFGLFRLPRRPLVARRGAGLVLLIVGSLLVQVR